MSKYHALLARVNTWGAQEGTYIFTQPLSGMRDFFCVLLGKWPLVRTRLWGRVGQNVWLDREDSASGGSFQYGESVNNTDTEHVDVARRINTRAKILGL